MSACGCTVSHAAGPSKPHILLILSSSLSSMMLQSVVWCTVQAVLASVIVTASQDRVPWRLKRCVVRFEQVSQYNQAISCRKIASPWTAHARTLRQSGEAQAEISILKQSKCFQSRCLLLCSYGSRASHKDGWPRT
eukprot:1542-Heterococcus_DN1.PRE.1